ATKPPAQRTPLISRLRSALRRSSAARVRRRSSASGLPSGSEGTARAERRPRRARRCTASQVAASMTSTPAGTDAGVASSGPRAEAPIRELLLGGQRPHHPVLDRALADQVDDVDAARLVLAPCPCDTLLEPRRVPGQVEIDHDTRGLEVQAETARIGGEKQPAARVALEPADLLAPLRLRHRTGVPREAQVHLARQRTRQLEHALPFREDDRLPSAADVEVLENRLQLVDLRALAVLRGEDVRRVAAHPHAAEPALQLL